MVTDTLQNQPSPTPGGGQSQNLGLIDPEKLYSIGQAAQILGVSIDTIRRWEQKGTLKAQRTAGMLRRFTGKELLDYQKEAQNQDLLVPISKAAQELHVSIQTLRRWDKSGKLRAERGPDGGRMYRLKTIREISHGLKNFPGNDLNDQSSDNSKNIAPIGENAGVSSNSDITANANYSDDTTHALALTDNTPLDTSIEISDSPHDLVAPKGKPGDDVEPNNPPPPPIKEVDSPPQQGNLDEEKHEQPVQSNANSYADEVSGMVTSVAKLADEAQAVAPPPPEPPAIVEPEPVQDPTPPPPVDTVKEQPMASTPIMPPSPPVTPEKLVVTQISTPSKVAPAFDPAGALTRPAIEDHGQNSCGSAIMPAHCNKVVIKTTAITKESHIFVTPTVAVDKPLFIAMTLANEGFAVACSVLPQADISFNWLIIDATQSP